MVVSWAGLEFRNQQTNQLQESKMITKTDFWAGLLVAVYLTLFFPLLRLGQSLTSQSLLSATVGIGTNLVGATQLVLMTGLYFFFFNNFFQILKVLQTSDKQLQVALSRQLTQLGYFLSGLLVVSLLSIL